MDLCTLLASVDMCFGQFSYVNLPRVSSFLYEFSRQCMYASLKAYMHTA